MSTPETETEKKRHLKGTGRKKIDIKLRENDQERMVTFSKRRGGLFRKASKLNSLTGYNLAIIVLSTKGRIYKHGDPSFDEVFKKYIKENKAENKLKKEENELVYSLRAISLAEYDDTNKLGMLKKKLIELKEMANWKLTKRSNNGLE